MNNELKALMCMVEAYRTSGGRVEHAARRDTLEITLANLLLERDGEKVSADELRTYYDLGYDVAKAKCIKVVEQYKVSVGNSRAGELAAEWTMDSLRDIRDEIKAL